DTDTGIHCDDCTGPVTLPFDVQFYDQTFTAGTPINVSSNGVIEFTSNFNGCCGYCLPQAGFNNLIAPDSRDLETYSASAAGIFTSVSGVAPNLILNIEWRAEPCCGGGSVTEDFEARLYEGQKRID